MKSEFLTQFVTLIKKVARWCFADYLSSLPASGADIKKALIETSLRKLYIYKRALVTKTAHCNTWQMETEYPKDHNNHNSMVVAALFT